VLAVTVRDPLRALAPNAAGADVSAGQPRSVERIAGLRQVAFEALEEQALAADGGPEIVSFLAHAVV
jgi:hypothetical protein